MPTEIGGRGAASRSGSAAAVLVLAAACAAAPGAPGGDGAPAPGVAPDGTGDLRLELAVDGAEGQRANAPLSFSIQALNEGDETLVLDFSSGQRFDIEVFKVGGGAGGGAGDAGGERVWRWSDGIAFTMALGRETLAPGAALRWEARLEDGLPAGQYRAVATITATEPRAVEEMLRIEP